MSSAKLALAIAIPYFGMTFMAGSNPVCYQDGTERRIEADLSHIADSLEKYASEVGRYPSDWSKLTEAGVDFGLHLVPFDPWEIEYHYQTDSFGMHARVFTLGCDGEPGGVEQDADVSVELRR
jgi:hypothetical protein